MDFDFMDIIFFLVWAFFLWKAFLGDRKKLGHGGEIPSPSSERKGEEKEEIPIPPREKPAPSETLGAPSPGKGYDYGKLRKRILTSWGEKKEDTKEASPKEVIVLNTEVKQKVEKTLSSKPISATIKKEVKPSLRPVSVSSSIAKDEKQWQEKAGKEEAQSHMDVAAFRPLSVETGKKRRKWNEKEAKKWLIYDAVFGTPRWQKPWRYYKRG